MPILCDFAWKLFYTPEDGDLVERLYVPLLSCAERYDRLTGYFTATALALAARGLEGLVLNNGSMRLIVGCTLGPAEVAAIERGEALRNSIERVLAAMPLAPNGDIEHQGLELLAWLVAQGRLEVKVAVPCDEHRRPLASEAIFHEKIGIVEDKTGQKVAFIGSLNETESGWRANSESLSLFTSWREPERVADKEAHFARLWADKAKRALVVDVPRAVREDLLRFLPEGDRLPQRLAAHGARLQPSVAVAAPRPAAPPRPEPLSREELRARVWLAIAAAANHPRGGERVAESTSAVTPWPHQSRAFRRMWRNWPPKLLIADEVGLGKSITTGLLLRQAVLSGRARRILLMAPKAVLRQWQVELREKLNLNWPIYDGQRLTWFPSPALRGGHERAVARDAWHREPFVIVSSHLLRRADRQAEVLSAESWDVVVLDEAHHARRKGAGGPQEGGPNRLLGLMRALRTRTQGLILLTATPMQVHPVEVWDLLDLLGLPPEWSKDAFLRFFEDLAQGNPSHEALDRMALLFQAAERHYGAIDEPPPETLGLASRLRAKKVLAALRDPASVPRRMLDADQRRAALMILKRGSPVARLINRHTRELLRDYHRTGRLSTPIATREVKDHFITLSPGEREVYDAVERYIRSTYAAAARRGVSPRERTAIGFVMTIYRRRLASSFHALRCTLRSRLATLVDPAAGPLKSVEEDFDQDEVDAPEEEEAVALASDALRWEERQDIERLLAMSERLAPDTKLAELSKVIETLRAEGYAQVMVFTQFTDTMDFLRENLAARRDPGRIMCLSGRGGEIRETDGTWRTVSRDEVKRRFRERQADLLLCTDAAAEGLNFQFCGALINYDSPWNPMRVEQRIGRIDRLGQQHAVVRVVNLHYADTVEADVYSALRRRIGLFTKVVGGLQPILSRLPTLIGEGLIKGEESAILERIEEEIDRLEEGGGFDLDRSVVADLDALPEEPSALTLADLDRILARPELLPAGTEVRRLDNRTYGLRLPGADEIRVTADPDLFEEHAGSMELWSPGNPCFPKLAPVSGAEAEQAGLLRQILS